jgi:enhancing lycopene biosynthesis protein 2
MPDQVAVILSGCGVYDGTEIHEASAVCVALTRAGKKPVFYAPDKTLHHEINHITLEPDDKTGRNVRVEAARIARGNVLNISVSTFYLK